MNTKLFLSMFLINAVAFAIPCLPVFSKAISPLEKMIFNPGELKLQYTPAIFHSNPEIEFLFQEKVLLSFATKMNTPNTIATSFIKGHFSNHRQAFESAYQKLTFKLWLLEKSKAKIKLDLTKLGTTGTFGGQCYVDISTLDALVTENPTEPQQEVIPNPAPIVKETPKPQTPPDRSAIDEKSPNLVDFSGLFPTR